MTDDGNMGRSDPQHRQQPAGLPPTPPTLLSMMQVLCSGTITNIQQRQQLRNIIHEFLNNSVSASKVYQQIAQIVGYQTFVDTVEGLVLHYLKQCAQQGIIPIGTHTPIITTGEAKLSGGHHTGGMLMHSDMAPPPALMATENEEGREITDEQSIELRTAQFWGVPRSMIFTPTNHEEPNKRPVAAARLRKISMLSPFPATRGFPTISKETYSSVRIQREGTNHEIITFGPEAKLAIHSPVITLDNIACAFPSSPQPPADELSLRNFDIDNPVRPKMWTKFDRILEMSIQGGLDKSRIFQCIGEVPPIMDRAEYTLSAILKPLDIETVAANQDIPKSLPLLVLYSPYSTILSTRNDYSSTGSTEKSTNFAGKIWILNMISRIWVSCYTTYKMPRDINGSPYDVPFASSVETSRDWIARNEHNYLTAISPAIQDLSWNKGQIFNNIEHNSSSPTPSGNSRPGAGMIETVNPQIQKTKRQKTAQYKPQIIADELGLIVVTPSSAVWRLSIRTQKWTCLTGPAPASHLLPFCGAHLSPVGDRTFLVIGGLRSNNGRAQDVLVIDGSDSKAHIMNLPIQLRLSNSVAHFLDEILPSQPKDMPDRTADAIKFGECLLGSALDRVGFESSALPFYNDLNTSSVFHTADGLLNEVSKAEKGPMNGIMISGGAAVDNEFPKGLCVPLQSGKLLRGSFPCPLSQVIVRPIYGPRYQHESSKYLLPGDFFLADEDTTDVIVGFQAVVHLSRLIPEVTGSLVTGFLEGLPENEYVKDLTLRPIHPIEDNQHTADSTSESVENALTSAARSKSVSTEEQVSTKPEATLVEVQQIMENQVLHSAPETLKSERIREHLCDLKTLSSRLNVVAFCVLTMGSAYASQYLSFPEVFMGRCPIIDKLCRDGLQSLEDFDEEEDTITMTRLPFLVSQGGLRAGFYCDEPSQRWEIHALSGLLLSYQGHTMTISSRAEGIETLQNSNRLQCRILEDQPTISPSTNTNTTTQANKSAVTTTTADNDATAIVICQDVYDKEPAYHDEGNESGQFLGSDRVPSLVSQLDGMGEDVKTHALKTLNRSILEDALIPTSGLLANMVLSVRHPFTSLGNLITNSIDAGSTEIHIEIGINSIGEREIVVYDDGSGMDYRTFNDALKSAGHSITSSTGAMNNGNSGVGLSMGGLRLGHNVLIATRSARTVGLGVLSQILTSRSASLETLAPLVMWSHRTKELISPGYGWIDTKHIQRLIVQFSGYSSSRELAEQMNFRKAAPKESEPPRDDSQKRAEVVKNEGVKKEPMDDVGSFCESSVEEDFEALCTGTRITISNLRDGATMPLILDLGTGAVRCDTSKASKQILGRGTEAWGKLLNESKEDDNTKQQQQPFEWKFDAAMSRYQLSWNETDVTGYHKGIHATFPYWSSFEDSIDRNLATYLGWMNLHNRAKIYLNSTPLIVHPTTEIGMDPYEVTLYRSLLKKLHYAVNITKLFTIKPLDSETILRTHPYASGTTLHARNDHGSVLMGFLNVDEVKLHEKTKTLQALPRNPNGISEAGILFYHNGRLINRYAIPLGASDMQLKRMSNDGYPALSGVLQNLYIPPVTCIVEVPTWYRPDFTKEAFTRQSHGDPAWAHLAECIERLVDSYCKAMLARQLGIAIPNKFDTIHQALESRLVEWMPANGADRLMYNHGLTRTEP